MAHDSTSSTSLAGSSWVGGRRAEAGTNPVWFSAFDPARACDLEPPFLAATTDDVHAAMRAASSAFEALSVRPPHERATLLERCADGLLELGDALIERARLETGLPGARLAAERDRTVAQLRMFAALVRDGSYVEASIDHGDPKRQPTPKPDVRRMLKPLGPVVVFGASNFPLAFSTLGGDSASALAAGCPVVVKGHPAHPGTGELVTDVVVRAAHSLELPAGTFSYLHAGGSREVHVGIELLRHPSTRAAGFTGSLAAGTALARIAAERPEPIPFFAEMGSVNPVFVLPAVLRDRAAAIADALFQSFTNSVGQMCTSPGLVFVPKGEGADRLAAALTQLVRAAPTSPMLTPKIRAAFTDGVLRLKTVPGVFRLAEVDGEGMNAGPALLATTHEALSREPAIAEEVFGPVLVLVECAHLDELFASAKLVHGSLAAALWMSEDDGPAAHALLARLEKIAGRVIVNGMPTGVEVCASMVHGGPFPATNRPESSAVGASALRRWCRPVAWQNVPDKLLPLELQEANPRKIVRVVDGRYVPATG
jgi:alpha-ketoglutaric semialdehyde dehydrogenase